MCLYHSLGDGQPQAKPTRVPRPGVIYPVETLKQMGQMLRGNAVSSIGNGDGEGLPVTYGRYCDLPARGCVFQAILYQICEYLPQTFAIASQLKIDLRRNI